MKKRIKIKFTDFWAGWIDNNNFIFNILSKKYDIELSETPEYLIYSVFGTDNLNYNCIKIFYTGENIVPDFNLCDYAIGFSKMVFLDRYFRYPLYHIYYSDLDACLKKHNLDSNTILKKKIGFCSFVSSNYLGADFRGKFYDALSEYKSVASGGRWKNNIGGAVSDKIDFQKKYKFCIAFENASQPGYVTEKIVQAFASEAVPIYWGDPDIAQTFNEKAFINCHNYNSVSDIINEIKRIDSNDELYKSMLRQQAFISNEDIKKLNNELELFLFNIFDQQIELAKRYNRDGINATLYTATINLKNRIYTNSLYNKLHKIKSILYQLVHKAIPIKDKFH